MSKVKVLVLIFVLFGLSTYAFAKVKVKKEVGFFCMFFNEKLKLSGNCDDNKTAVIKATPTGIMLTGFGKNPPIPLKLSSDTRATATDIKEFGLGNHNGIFDVVDGGTLSFEIMSPTGRCNGFAAGGIRCVYTVAAGPGAACAGPFVCGPCVNKTCPDLPAGAYWVQGTPAKKCTLTLTAPSSCSNCGGLPGIVPVN